MEKNKRGSMQAEPRVLTLGDMVVEIMRDKVGQGFKTPGGFKGPFPSGAPAIFAGALSTLGIKTAIVGAVGDDEFGEVILERLRAYGVDISKVHILSDYPTGVAFVTYFQDGSRKFIYYVDKSAAGQVEQQWLDNEFLKQFTHLHIMGTSLAINNKWRRFTLQVARALKQRGATISFDPNLRLDMMYDSREACLEVLSFTDIFLPSEQEIQELTETGDPQEAAKAMFNKGVKVVAIKQGAAGSLIITHNEKFKCEAYEVEEVDPTGAGDCYDAGFLTGYFRGWSWREIAEFANAAGALAVSKKGPMEGISSFRKIQKFIASKR